MANGPGGVEEGRVSLRVVPDTSRFAADLRGQLEKLRRELSLAIPVELDTSGIAEHARAATAEAQAAAGNVHIKADVDKNNLRSVARTFTNFAEGIASGIKTILGKATFAGIGLTAAAAIPNILALSGSLAQLTGVVALLPAVFAGAGATLATLVIGMQGFGTALKDIGDPAKFAQDLKDLAPNAQLAAKAIAELQKPWEKLQKTVQQHLFAGVNDDIKQTARVFLPVLAKGLTAIADGLNLIEHDAAVAIQSLTKSGVVATIFSNIGLSLKLMAPALADMLTVFTDVAAIGSQFLPALAGDIQKSATALRNFIDTPKGSKAVSDFISTALQGFGQLFDVVKGVASIIIGIVKAAQNAGGSGLGSLATLLGSIADVVNSPAFQKGLTSVFAGLLQGARQLATALKPLSDALLPLLPLVGALAIALGTALAAAIKAVAPALQILFQALAPQLLEGLGKILPLVVHGFADLAPILSNVATYLAQNKPLLAAVGILIAALVGPITAAVVAVLLLAANFQAISAFFTNTIVPAFLAVTAALQPTIQAFITLGTTIVGAILAILPIVEQIVAVFVGQWPAISATVTQVMTNVQNIVVSVMTIIGQIIKAEVAIILIFWSIFGSTILATINRVFPAVLQIVRGVFQVLAGLFQAVADLLTGKWSKLWGDFSKIMTGQLNIIVGAFRGIGGLLIGAVEAIGDQLAHVGIAIITGIVAGITKHASAIGDAVKGALKGAIKAANLFAIINSPSKLFAREIGEPISRGIAQGVDTASPSVSDAVTRAITPPAVGDFGVPGAGAGRAGVIVENVTVKDVDEMAKALTEEQRDAAVVANLQAQLVGA